MLVILQTSAGWLKCERESYAVVGVVTAHIHFYLMPVKWSAIAAHEAVDMAEGSTPAPPPIICVPPCSCANPLG